ncbi:MAG: filamentous hemagglutinin N-terminal domain-containing protein, partial [Limisphaerales bacterium]
MSYPLPFTHRAATLAFMAAALAPYVVRGNPAGLTVQSGSATASAAGGHLTVTASHNAILNWQSFNLAPGERTSFVQPSSSSVVWNKINDASPSQVFGRLDANGVVVLQNRAGFFFGPDAFVSAAGLVVTTATATPVEGAAGLFWQFQGAPPAASIVNYGRLETGPSGSAFLIADRIENHGEIAAPGGTIGLAAGRDVLLSERPDGRGLSATVSLPSGSIDNTGRLVADAGTVALHARVVNQGGLVQAASVRERHGVIELVAADAVTLGPNSVLSASGGEEGLSGGGSIVVKSGGSYADTATSRLGVAGGAQGGDGGFVEISAPVLPAIRAQLDGQAASGSRGGRLLLDPQNIVISSGGGGTGSGSVGAGDPPAGGTLTLDVNSAFTGFSEITLQATRNITVAAGTQWDLGASTGLTAPGSLLKLEAGNNVTVAAGAAILAAENWSVTIQAGRDFSAPDLVTPGVGSILFSGTGALQAQNGQVSLLAGNNVTVAAGHVRTVAGGDLTVRTLAGNIATGTKANGFRFLPSGYAVDADLGGISTAAGGDVTLAAGQDVVSFLPLAGGQQGNAGSGAFGAAPGD